MNKMRDDNNHNRNNTAGTEEHMQVHSAAAYKHSRRQSAAGWLAALGAAFIMAVMALVFTGEPALMRVSASFNAARLEGRDSLSKINNDDREVAYVFLIEHKNRLLVANDVSPEAKKRLEDIFYEANKYIANTDMTVTQLTNYVNSVESDMSNAVTVNVVNAQQFLFVNNSTEVVNGKYGEKVTLNLSLVNLGQVDITDVVVTPTVDADVDKWPFVIEKASDPRTIDRLKASTLIEAPEKQRNMYWDLTVNPEVKTGTFPLTFHVIYYRNGAVEETDVKSYAHITGDPKNGKLGEDEDETEKTATPRIIVTGFTTDPATVYAGNTFKLMITVKNTSATTTVSNIQFDLKAAKEGKEQDTTYEAFLPTSGSATLYVPSIAPGASTDLEIEMSARSDLVQKPYVIELHAQYEDAKHNPYTADTNVSIPVRQEARVDSGEAEILPESIEVGGSANIMFQIYNMGKVILYNVKVRFEGDSIEGGSTFIGKLDSGATGNVDAMVNGVAPTMDDGTITAIISYEDEAGHVTEIEKPLNLYVSEPVYDEGMYDDGMMGEEMPEEEKTFPWGMVLGIGGGVAVLAVILIAVLKAKKKKKKRQEELDAMDEDE